MTRDFHRWATALAFELAPAALFNFAAAFAVATVMQHNGLGELAAGAALAAGIAAFLLAWFALRAVGKPNGRFALSPFEHPDVEPSETATDMAELLLSEQVAAPAAVQQSVPDELLLDDVVESPGSDSRVVRLFEQTAIPTAGELQARIDRHLRSDSPRATPPDATEALQDAILALRQSLR